ncbi:MAG TPA: S41 family peptidase [Thermoanaerobaculia bacterium]|nr:S41 family peptidase [Thermoanaerobaculia bacterium]
MFRIDGLMKLCDVWSTVRFLDPRLMVRKIDWDGALVRAIPKVREARTSAERARAIDSMLAELSDPVTRVVMENMHQLGESMPPMFRWDGDVLVINIGPYADAVSEESELFIVESKIAPELAKARSVVFDLRTRNAETPGWILENVALVRERVEVAARRCAFHSGYAPQSGSMSGRYYSGLQVIASPSIEPAPSSTSVPARIVFIVGSDVPERVAALWRAGSAAIVSERPISGDNIARTRQIDLGGGWTAAVRVTETTVTGLAADAVVAPVAGDDRAMKSALALAREPAPLPARPARHETAAAPIAQNDAAYADMSSPELPYRLLALFRLWSVIDRFYPYKDLIGDWDAVLREFIPRFEQARDGKEYALAVMEVVARVEDGHSSAWGSTAIWDLIGVASVPIEVRRIEGRFIVTGKRELLPKDSSMAIGDEIVSIDGEAMADRISKLRKYLTASTEAARTANVLAHSIRGPRDSVAAIGVRGADGKTRTIKIARTRFSPIAKQGEVWRVLEGSIGYVDLTRLTIPQIDEMFVALNGTKAIIFDMRGYPKGTGWSIASRINTKNAPFGAIFRRRELSVLSPEEAYRSGFYFEQSLAKTEKPKYAGRTVMLIDDRAMSQAEQTGLWFEAANGTKFIGSNSAGANGDMTNLVLPGGINVSFTGQEVRHADGRQLQRIGLVPHIEVKPTVGGIRNGRDEVLEDAIAYLAH